MPTYGYMCDCGVYEDIVKPMSEHDRSEVCPECGAQMRRDYSAAPRVHADSYSKEIHSDALAVHPDQRAEHQRLYPNVPLDKACRPVLSSFSQAEKYYEQRGIYKPPQRNRRRKTKVS